MNDLPNILRSHADKLESLTGSRDSLAHVRSDAAKQMAKDMRKASDALEESGNVKEAATEEAGITVSFGDDGKLRPEDISRMKRLFIDVSALPEPEAAAFFDETVAAYLADTHQRALQSDTEGKKNEMS